MKEAIFILLWILVAWVLRGIGNNVEIKSISAKERVQVRRGLEKISLIDFMSIIILIGYSCPVYHENLLNILGYLPCIAAAVFLLIPRRIWKKLLSEIVTEE